MPKYALSLIVNETDEKISVNGEFSDEHWKLFELFLKEAESLENTKLVQVGDFGNSSLNWNKETGSSVFCHLPDWDNVTVFLHKFPPLLLQDEKTNFFKIHNILVRELKHAYFISMLGEQHALFSGKKNKELIQIKSNDVLVNSEKVLFHWLNSHEFHRDEDKQEFIEQLHQLLPLDFFKVIFLSLLKEKFIAVHNLAIFIRVLLGKEKDANMQFYKKNDETS